MGAPDFSKFKTIIHELICVKNNFYPAIIKNENGAVAMRIFFVRHERIQQLHQLTKGRHRDIEDLLKCASMFF